MKIKICKKFTKVNKLQNKLSKAFPNDDIIIKKCLNLCKLCKHQPIAKMKGRRLKAKRITELISKIKESQT
ncbi:MAG TPA: DUF1450 domain-containing protein [Epsilonproteobacteria bacterium]|nr:DUF1450 domain-containing protein [Campylobacterota bacterium]